MPAGARRTQILDCALSVFSEKGYHQSSIADVCSRARIGRATLYQHFEDKRDLLRALADRVATRVITVLKDREPLHLSPGALPTRAQILSYMEMRFTLVFSAVFADAATARLVLFTGRGADGVADELLGRIEQAILELTIADLREAQRVGLVRDFDVEVAARYFLGGLEKVVMTSLDDDAVDPAALAKTTAEIQLFGLFAPLTSPPTVPAKGNES